MKAGWELIALGSVAELGPNKKEVQPLSVSNPEVSFVPMDRLGVGQKALADHDAKPLSEVYKSYTYFRDGDVLLAKITPCFENGKLGIASDLTNGIGFGSSEFFVLRPNTQLISAYLYYYLSRDTFRFYAQGRMQGAVGHKRVPKEEIERLEIPLPPLEEQQRIVAILDEAFDGLNRARTNAEANLKSARELFDIFASSVFRPDESNEEGAFFTTLGDVCEIQSGAGFPLQFQGNTSGAIPFYKVSDMNLPGNEAELCVANNYVSEGVRRQLGAKVFPKGAIVFPKVGGAIATNKKRIVETPGCVDNNVMGLIPDGRRVLPEYLHEWLRAFDILEFSNKANPPSITQSTVARWPLRLPTKEEQFKLVLMAESLREQTQALAYEFQIKIQNLDDLRQSLLKKAFAGELT